MGEVFLAHDTPLNRRVAIKFLPESLAQDETARKRFPREAHSAAALDHPYICSIHEVGEAEGRSFIVMEYVEGQTLRDRQALGQVSLQEAMGWAVEIAEALVVAHQKGIIHRDLKPSNIMLARTGHAKVMDFGLAKQVSASPTPASQEQTLTGLTREGTTVGTLPYMSPEQLQGGTVDQRSDLFSFGVVLYEMLAGAHPFKKDHAFETANAIAKEEPVSLSQLRQDFPQQLQAVIDKSLAKIPAQRYQSAEAILADLRAVQGAVTGGPIAATTARRPRVLSAMLKPRYAAGLIIVLSMGAFLAYRSIRHQAGVRWARNVAIPEIKNLVEDVPWVGDYTKPVSAFRLAKEAEQYLPEDPAWKALWPLFSAVMTVTTDPPGARVFMKAFSSTSGNWEYVGLTPLEKIRVPRAYYRWRFETDGCENVFAVAAGWQPNLHRVLDLKGTVPEGMVRVAGDKVEDVGTLGDFFIDRCEVTNAQYKKFVDAGGYQNRDYWKNEFSKDAKKLQWEQAMRLFIDTTGRPGPATWEAGGFPSGQDEYPVSGISWYEAAAYAEFVGKALPTTYHWELAAGFHIGSNSNYFATETEKLSNFSNEGPARVGTREAISAFGAYDMAGNVREWCWNQTQAGRVIRGGAWNDFIYMYGNVTQAALFDRSPKNGLRCVKYVDKDNIPEQAFGPYDLRLRDLSKETPAPEAIYKVYRDQFLYDQSDLNARVEQTDEKSPDWVKEKVTFAAAYGKERVIIHLFLPRNAAAPYQAVIFYPGNPERIYTSPSDDPFMLPAFDFIIKNGRAVIDPVYYGTHERNTTEINWEKVLPVKKYQNLHVELLIKWVKDFMRTVDYLETRKDIDASKLGYYGVSWGGEMGNIIPAVERRLQASVLFLGGIAVDSEPRPEADEFDYTSHVILPTLMLNGKYDRVFPYQISVLPMFNLLGTPREHKSLLLYDTDHYIPRKDLIKETLAWFDRYLGPVK